MPTDNFLLAVGYTRTNPLALDTSDVLGYGIAKAYGESAYSDHKDFTTARAKYVGAIDGTNMAVGFESNLVYGENKAYGLKTDLYLTPKLSVGASYAQANYSSDQASDNFSPIKSAWGANVNYFITPAVAVGASYVNANAVGEAVDTQTVGVNAKFRF